QGYGRTLHHGPGYMGDSSLGGSRESSLGPAGTKLQQKPKRLCLTGPDSRKCGAEPRQKGRLVRFAPLLLAQSLPRKRFFGPALLAGFHVEAVLLDFLDDVFLLHLALEAAQGIFQRLTLLNDDFCHCINSPPIRFGLDTVRCSLAAAHHPWRLSHEVDGIF